MDVVRLFCWYFEMVLGVRGDNYIKLEAHRSSGLN